MLTTQSILETEQHLELMVTQHLVVLVQQEQLIRLVTLQKQILSIPSIFHLIRTLLLTPMSFQHLTLRHSRYILSILHHLLVSQQSVSIAHPTLDCQLLSPTQLKAQLEALPISESDTDGHLVMEL